MCDVAAFQSQWNLTLSFEWLLPFLVFWQKSPTALSVAWAFAAGEKGEM